MKPESLPIFLHAITPRESYYKAATAARRRALLKRVLITLAILSVITGALAGAADRWMP